MKYLSPTTFIKFRKCEHRVYLEKIEKVLPETEQDQTLPQACGIGFDILVKGALNRRINVQEELNKKIQSKNKAALLVAKQLFECYNKDAIPQLKKEGIGYGGVDQEIEIYYENSKSILYGMPDLTLKNGEVLDWKCQGMFGKGKVPDKGYIRCYVYGIKHYMHGKDIGEENNIPMELINEDWAIQLYLYNRLLGHVPGDSLRAGVENITVDKDLTVYCASYRNFISKEFQIQIEKEFHSAFEKLQNKKTEEPYASKYKCTSYGKLCPVATFCSSYNNITEKGRKKLI